MLHLLQHPASSSSLTSTLDFGPPILNAYAKIAKILRRAAPPAPTPVPPQRVQATVPPPVPPQMVRILISSPIPPTWPTKLLPPKHRLSLPSNYRVISPRFQTRPPPRLKLAQSIQHNPTSVAGKMCHPVTGHPETIDTLLRGPDSTRWTISLTNKWARCSQCLSTNRPHDRHIVGNQTTFFIRPGQLPA